MPFSTLSGADIELAVLRRVHERGPFRRGEDKSWTRPVLAVTDSNVRVEECDLDSVSPRFRCYDCSLPDSVIEMVRGHPRHVRSNAIFVVLYISSRFSIILIDMRRSSAMAPSRSNSSR